MSGRGIRIKADRPVMLDVARLAGVSHQTVSRTLNAPASVRPDTRRRVESAIQQLGYRPDAAARSLASHRSRTIGVIAGDMSMFGPASTVNAVEAAAAGRGYAAAISPLRGNGDTDVMDAVGRLIDQSVAGLIVVAATRTAIASLRTLATSAPVVAAEGDAGPGIASVALDQVAGARAATEHLLDLGHRVVHHLAGPEDWVDAELRQIGWREALASRSRRVPSPLVGDWTARSGYEMGRRMLRRSGVTAVFCANDQMALGLLRSAHEVGRAVPSSLSVVGFDDIPESGYLVPPLTTVAQDFAELGRRAVDRLLALIEGADPDGDSSPLSVPRLVLRSSTAAPRLSFSSPSAPTTDGKMS